MCEANRLMEYMEFTWRDLGVFGIGKCIWSWVLREICVEVEKP